MKTIARFDDGISTIGELIEYPKELEGTRNFFQKLPDVDLRDDVTGHNKIQELSETFDLKGYGSSTRASIEIVEGNIYVEYISGTYLRGIIKNLEANKSYVLSYTLSHEGDLGDNRMYTLFNKIWYSEEDNGKRFTDLITTDEDGAFETRVWYNNGKMNADNITFKIEDIKVEIASKELLSMPVDLGIGSHLNVTNDNWTPAPEDLGLVYPDWVQNFGMSFSENGIVTQEIFEVESEQVIFEDDFTGGTRKDGWTLEKWGSDTDNVSESHENGGWLISHSDNTGHASIGLFADLPNVSSGIVTIEFDWQPHSEIGSYRGSYVRIRSDDITRNSLYGRTNGDNLLELVAYQESKFVTVDRDDLTASTTEVSSYKIKFDIDKSIIDIYVNGNLEKTITEEYKNDLKLEFSFGGYDEYLYTFFDNVMVSHEEDATTSLGKKITTKEFREGDI